MSASAKYGFAKKILIRVPGLREGLATAFTRLPDWLAPSVYEFSRATLFPDNNQRLPVFEQAFAHVAASGNTGDYLEFGVARGTSLITSYKMAARFPELSKMKFHAFDSFEGLPSAEGLFIEGDMAYQRQTFERFTGKAGVDHSRMTITTGRFDKSLTATAPKTIGIVPGKAHIAHIDCDLYASTVPVLDFLAPLLGPGSVIIFDDWFNFDHEDVPAEHGEQRAFAEWSERGTMSELAIKKPWNAAFAKAAD